MNSLSKCFLFWNLLAAVLLCPRYSPAAEVEFEPVLGLLQIPDHITLGGVSAVAVDSQGRVFVLHRAAHPVMCFEPTGEFVRAFGDDLIGSGHGLRVDRDDHIWVTDTDHHVVFKFDEKGELLLTLGEPDQPGLEPGHFNKPTDVGFGPEGEIYVTDGYGNSRVVKFSRDGRFVATWGEAGDGPVQFKSPHAVVVDGQNRVLIADRDNNRIQIFSPEGKLLETWAGYTPFGITIDPQGDVYVSDGKNNQILRLDKAGKVVQKWGEKGDGVGQFSTPHMLESDRQGNLYAAEVSGKRVQKLVRKP